jgi:hypothetical protein
MSSRKLDKMFKKGMPDSPLQMKGDLDKDGKTGANSRARDLVAKKARLQKRIKNKEKANK